MAKESRAVAAKKEQNTLPAAFMEELAADAGSGIESATSDDMSIPFIKLAQALSPEVNKRESVYIDGLEQGDFFNSATQSLWKGEEGFRFVPVKFRRTYLEWIPRENNGGGFAGEHGPEIMEKVTVGDSGVNFLPNGNTIAVTHVWYGFLISADDKVEQCVVSLSATQLKKSKMLVTKLKSVLIPGPNNKKFNPAIFFNVIRVTSVPESNDKGSWMGWKFEIAGSVFDIDPSGDLYGNAKSMLEAIDTGRIKAATPADDGAAGAGGASNDEGGGKPDKDMPF